MAGSNNRVSALILIALLFAASYPLGHGQNITLDGLRVNGRLCCTPTGNCPVQGGQGVAGVPVTLNCTIFGVSTTLGRATTNTNGTFNINVPALTGLILGFPIVPCVASTQLPFDSTVICPTLSTVNGTLVSAIRSAGTFFNQTIGTVQNATLTGFINLRA
ncbi:hypothetical protein CASFOL_025578 [Castilleja foliolosa]|uniref:Uncharacterized protein n=1 Tax=Castilleja foliolosa TaxID=1961234 RepID=A0ABD3CSQ1_9LAMI